MWRMSLRAAQRLSTDNVCICLTKTFVFCVFFVINLQRNKGPCDRTGAGGFVLSTVQFDRCGSSSEGKGIWARSISALFSLLLFIWLKSDQSCFILSYCVMKSAPWDDSFSLRENRCVFDTFLHCPHNIMKRLFQSQSMLTSDTRSPMTISVHTMHTPNCSVQIFILFLLKNLSSTIFSLFTN